MSRIGKQLQEIPKGVTVSFADHVLTVKGPKGELKRQFPKEISFIVEGDTLKTAIADENDLAQRAMWGTAGSHAENMILGVTAGYSKKLEIQGVGYKVEMMGKDLKFALGFSHPVIIKVPEGIKVAIEKSFLTISGFDKEAVGQFTANIVAWKKPEPYKGKGIRYEGQVVPIKQGKKAVA